MNNRLVRLDYIEAAMIWPDFFSGTCLFYERTTTTTITTKQRRHCNVWKVFKIYIKYPKRPLMFHANKMDMIF